MPDYRLYHLDSQGRIAKAEDFEADDDEAARLVAGILSPRQEWELWCEARIVERASVEEQADAVPDSGI
jgi:hypothetical protein